MRYAYFLLILLTVACHSSPQKEDSTKTPTLHVKATSIDPLKPNSVARSVAANHGQLKGINGDLISFKKYLSGLSDNDLASIPYALDYIKTCLPSDLTERDSIVLLFNVKFFKVSNKLSEELETKYPTLIKQLEKDIKSRELSIFQDNLKACGIGIFSTEGNYYLDILPNYLYNNFKDRVSIGVKTYLDIRRHELTEGFSEDAGLLISYKQLYQRVKNWEKFINNFPKTVYTNEANNYYETYLETLLTGMDNTPVFEMDNNSLSAEVKTLYEKAIHDDADTRTGKIIADYYALLSRHDLKQTDSIDVFLKAHNLSSMSGVQPDTR